MDKEALGAEIIFDNGEVKKHYKGVLIAFKENKRGETKIKIINIDLNAEEFKKIAYAFTELHLEMMAQQGGMLV